MPSAPAKVEGGWMFNFPQPTQAKGHVHALTKKLTRPLTVNSCLTLTYEIATAPGALIVPKDYPTNPAVTVLFIQRKGDNWSARGAYEAYRWYGTSQILPLVPGPMQGQLCFTDIWTAVLTSSSVTNAAAFKDAWLNAERIGFVLGGGDGFGHGVYATGPATFTYSFEVTER
jgi:hypothetical protein